MAEYYRDVWHGLDGNPHRVRADFGAETITVDTDPPITAGQEPLFARGMTDNGGVTAVAFKGHDDDLAWVTVGGAAPSSFGATKGNWPCAFHEGNGNIYIQHDQSGFLSIYDWAGVLQGTVAAPYAAEGIHHVTSGGVVVMGTDPSLQVVVNGELWLNTVEDAGVKVGQFGYGPYGGALAKYENGAVARWLGYTPHPPRLVVAGGAVLVAISWVDTPEPDAVPWVGGAAAAAVLSPSPGAGVLAQRARAALPIPPRLPRAYPHVDQVAEWATQQSLRLAWDRVFAQEETQTTIQAQLAAERLRNDRLAERIDALARQLGITLKD